MGDEVDGGTRRERNRGRWGGRLPPGQTPTPDGVWPVLHVEMPAPKFDPETWDFTIRGLVAEPTMLRWSDWQALPRVAVTTDLHCVTRWSTFANEWGGVRFLDLWALARPLPGARAAMWFAEGDYTTNVLLEDLLRPDVIMAETWNGRPIGENHGGPVRLIVPHLYAWKSCKWPRGFEVLAADAPGYWEQRGYHMRGDPFAEERFG